MEQPVCENKLLLLNNNVDKSNEFIPSIDSTNQISKLHCMRTNIAQLNIYNFIKNVSSSVSNGHINNHILPFNHTSLDNNTSTTINLNHSNINGSTVNHALPNSTLKDDITTQQLILIEYLKFVDPRLELLTEIDLDNCKTINNYEPNSANYTLLETLVNTINPTNISSLDQSNLSKKVTESSIRYMTFDKSSSSTLKYDEFAWFNSSLGKVNQYFSAANMRNINIIEETPYMMSQLPLQESRHIRKNVSLPPGSTFIETSSKNISTNKTSKRRSTTTTLNLLQQLPHQQSLQSATSNNSNTFSSIKIQRQRRRQRHSISAHNDSFTPSFVPLNTSLASTVEPLQYTEVLTPLWKKYTYSNNNNILTDITVEDLSDEAYIDRHALLELEESKKYMLALQTSRRHKKRNSTNTKSSHVGKNERKNNIEPNNSVTITLYNEDSVSQLLS